MSIVSNPFQLLELNVISAQDLARVSSPLRTYAVTWIHPDRKLSSRIDTHGDINPTWNDKFVFRVKDEFLYADTSAIMIEIYALHWFKDVHVGSVRVLVSNLVTPPPQSEGMKFVALQVRRRSGRPQGILNIGMTVLDRTMQSMPLYTQSPSAVGYRHLMGEKNACIDHNHKMMTPQVLFGGENINNDIKKPQLRRTKSDISSMSSLRITSRQNQSNEKSLSKSTARDDNGESSVGRVTFSNEPDSTRRVSHQARSGGYPGHKPKSTANSINNVKKDDKNDGVVLNEFDDLSLSSESTEKKFDYIDEIQRITPRTDIVYEIKASPKLKFNQSHKVTSKNTPLYALGRLNDMSFEYSTPRRSNLGNFGPPIITESELGPSPSEVAAAIAREPRRIDDDGESSPTMGGWSMDDSVEGLQSKLERWQRTNLTPVYDCDDLLSFPTTSSSSSSKTNRTRTRRTKSESGLFSCFGNVCGFKCSIVYNNGNAKKKVVTIGDSKLRRRTQSADSANFD